MQTAKSKLLALICASLLGACGFTGALYLADDNSASKPAAGQTSDEQESKKDADQNDGHQDN